MRDWKLAFHTRSHWVHHHMSLFDSVAAIREAGFDAVEISMPHLHSLKIETMSAADRQAFRRRFADLGMEIAAISGHSTICHEDDQIRQQELAFFKQAIDFAADVGAEVVNTHAMYRQVGQPTGFFRPEPGERMRDFMRRAHGDPPAERRGFVLDILGDLASHAARRGVFVGLEDLDPTPVMLWENLVREINSPGLRMNLQVRRGTTPAKAYRERADIVHHFHLLPPQEGAGFEGWSRGEYIEFISALEELSYPRDYFTIEEHSELDPNVTAPQIQRYFRQLLV
ncbi:MAG TPA: sugar phosphate isomerase/epimerase family protein [Chloroflexota bacterium]|jgi:sugar phosphate isomerase/epimerase|nr:sugar phosphate isomerase/epimerase family protein [Chloroflexota bacterium]